MITEITRDELKQKLDHPKKFTVVETLPPESYHQAHLPGAINLPLERVQELAPDVLPNKDAEVIASAKMDNRSSRFYKAAYRKAYSAAVFERDTSAVVDLHEESMKHGHRGPREPGENIGAGDRHGPGCGPPKDR